MATRTSQVIFAFAVVYLVWGSTYLGIRIAVQSDWPPALFAGERFVAAGLLMLAYARFTGAPWPRALADWRTIAISGVLMLVGANGLVTWSEQWIASNQAALIVATSALWLAWMGTWGAQGEKLNPVTVLGLLLGFGGVAVLVGSGVLQHGGPVKAYIGLAASPLLWSAGSIYARRHPVGTTPIMSAALQTCVAAVGLMAIALANGDPARWHYQPRAMAAMVYLVLFGSCLAYGAYVWLVHNVSPARLGTYAYVNPAVAVLLGWWMLDEQLNRAQVLGTLTILVGVVIVTFASGRRKPA